MTYALLISIGLGALCTGTFAFLWKSAQKALVEERAAHNVTRSNLVATQGAVMLSESGRSSELARLEAVIAEQKKVIAELEAHQDLSPEGQRARLARLSDG